MAALPNLLWRHFSAMHQPSWASLTINGQVLKLGLVCPEKGRLTIKSLITIHLSIVLLGFHHKVTLPDLLFVPTSGQRPWKWADGGLVSLLPKSGDYYLKLTWSPCYASPLALDLASNQNRAESGRLALMVWMLVLLYQDILEFVGNQEGIEFAWDQDKPAPAASCQLS